MQYLTDIIKNDKNYKKNCVNN